MTANSSARARTGLPESERQLMNCPDRGTLPAGGGWQADWPAQDYISPVRIEGDAPQKGFNKYRVSQQSGPLIIPGFLCHETSTNIFTSIDKATALAMVGPQQLQQAKTMHTSTNSTGNKRASPAALIRDILQVLWGTPTLT